MKEQIGNFIVESEGENDSRIRVKTVSGDWDISFMIGTSTHAFISMLLDGNRDVLHMLIVLWYEVSMVIPDGEVMEGMRKLYDEYYGRLLKNFGGLMEGETEEQVLDELRRMEEAKNDAAESNS